MPRKPDLSRLQFDSEGNVVAKFCTAHDTHAGAWMPADQFIPSQKYVGGLHNVCRSCQYQRHLQVMARHPELRTAKQLRYAAKHPEKLREYRREYERRKRAEARAAREATS